MLLTGESLKPKLAKSRCRKRRRTPSTTSSASHQPVEDPFDCNSIRVLPTHDIVESTLHQYLEKWKELDDRKVNQKTTTANISNKTQDASTAVGTPASNFVAQPMTNTNNNGGWRAMEDRLSLPEGFDFNTKSDSHQGKDPPIDDGFSGERVISMTNPTETLSYHRELWKLFDSIPTHRELEEQARGGHSVTYMQRIYAETHNLTGVTSDGSASSRLRMPERHGLPQSSALYSRDDQQKGTELQRKHAYNSHFSTVVFEFWRRQPKRGASSDCHRMLIEFLDSQTLWDVHMILEQMVEDDLWMTTGDHEGSGNNDRISIDNSSLPYDDETQTKTRKPENYDPSGCFFIENTFYKTGPVDYVTCICDWIDGNNPSHSIPLRKRYLGIDPTVDISYHKTMKGTKLSQIPFRLNIRYYHACHGDVETAVILVDRKFISTKTGENSSESVYPLIHDVWTPARFRLPATPICDACEIYQSVFQTSLDCKTTDGGPRSLCIECCRDLRLLENEKESVKLHRVWRDQANLSTRIARDHGLSF